MNDLGPHNSAPWARYANLAPLLKGDGLKLSAADYDFAARCINEHAEMLEACQRALSWLISPGDLKPQDIESAKTLLRAAIRRAAGED